MGQAAQRSPATYAPRLEKITGDHQMSSILFGDTMVPIIEQDYILLLGYSFYIRDIILLGSTTNKDYSSSLT